MVTRAPTSSASINLELAEFNRLIGQMRPGIRGTILPVLGLSAAFAVLNGGINTATEGGLALTSAGYQLTTSLYGLQDVLAQRLIPFIEAAVPVLATVADQIVAADEATNGWSTRLLLLGGAAWAASPALRAIGGGAAAVGATRLAGGAAAGALGASAYGAATGDTRAARFIDQELGAKAAVDSLIGILSPGLGDRLRESDTGPFETQAEIWRQQLMALERISNAVERYTPTSNNFFLTSYDDNEMLRRLRTFLEQGTLDDVLGR